MSRAGGAGGVPASSCGAAPPCVWLLLSSGKDAQVILTNIYLPKGLGKPNPLFGEEGGGAGAWELLARCRISSPPPVGTERQFPTTQPKELFLLLLPARSPVSLRSWLLNSTRKAGREDEGCCVHQGFRAQGWDRAGIPRGGRWQGRGSGLWHISGCSTHGAQNGLWMEQRGPRYGVIPPGGHGLPR